MLTEIREAIRILPQGVTISEKDMVTTIYKPEVYPLLVTISNFLQKLVFNEMIEELFLKLEFNQTNLNHIIPDEWDKYLKVNATDTPYDILQRGLRVIKHLSRYHSNSIPVLKPLKKINGVPVTQYRSAVELYSEYGDKIFTYNNDTALDLFSIKRENKIVKKRMSLEEVEATGGREALGNTFHIPNFSMNLDNLVESTQVYNDCTVVTLRVADSVREHYKKPTIKGYKINGQLYDKYGIPITEDCRCAVGLPVLWSLVRFSDIEYSVVINTHSGKTIVPISNGNRIILPDGKLTGRPITRLKSGYGNVIPIVDGYITLNLSTIKLQTTEHTESVECLTCSPSDTGSLLHRVSDFYNLSEFARYGHARNTFSFRPPRVLGLSLMANELTTKLFQNFGVNTNNSIMRPDLLKEVPTPKGRILAYHNERYSNKPLKEYASLFNSLSTIVDIPPQGLTFLQLSTVIGIIHGHSGADVPTPTYLFLSAMLSTPVSFKSKLSSSGIIEQTPPLERTTMVNKVIPHVNYITLTVNEEYYTHCANNPDEVSFLNRNSISFKYNNLSISEFVRLQKVFSGYLTDNMYVNKNEININPTDTYWSEEEVPNMYFEDYVLSYFGEEDDVFNKKKFVSKFRYVFGDGLINATPYPNDIVHFNEFGDKPFVRYLTNAKLDVIYQDEICQLTLNQYGELVIVYEGELFMEYNYSVHNQKADKYTDYISKGFLPITNEVLSLQAFGINVEPFSGESYLYNPDVGLMEYDNLNEIDFNVGLGATDESPVKTFLDNVHHVHDGRVMADVANQVKLTYEKYV